MKKKIIIIITAVIVAAGIGTGVFFAAKTNKDRSADNTLPGASESTDETMAEDIEYGSSYITKEEYDSNEPIQQTAVTDFVKGKFYAPTQYDTGNGLANINWSSDGMTVTVGELDASGDSDEYTVYKLNEFGEPILMTSYYYYSYDDGSPNEYRKEVEKPTYVYNDQHWVVKNLTEDYSDLYIEKYTDSYNHDSKGNITGIHYGVGNTENIKFTYDEYGNLVKFTFRDYYDSEPWAAGSGNDFLDIGDKIITVKNELNSVGLPTKKQEFFNGNTYSDIYSFSYTEVSEAQYNFYNQIVKTLFFLQAHDEF